MGIKAVDDKRYWVTTVEDNHGDFDDEAEFDELADAMAYAAEVSPNWEWVISVVDTQVSYTSPLCLFLEGDIFTRSAFPHED